MVRLLIPNGLAVGVGYAGFILDTAFASKARELAGLPAIANAWLLVGLPIALLGQAIGQSAFPRIAALAAALDWRKMLRTVLGSLGIAVVLRCRRWLSSLCWDGRSFTCSLSTASSTPRPERSPSVCSRFMQLHLPAYVGTEVVTRGLIALRDTRTPLLTNSAQLAGRAAMMSLLIGSRGVLAVPLSLAVTASLETIALLGIFLTKVSRRSRDADLSPARVWVGRAGGGQAPS